MAAPTNDFETADYPALRVCSLAARGLWSDMRYLMRHSRRFGYLHQAGKPLTLSQLALTTGCATDEVRLLVQELIDAGVCAHVPHEGYYSPRMVAYESFRAKCVKGGEKGFQRKRNAETLEGSPSTLQGSSKGCPKGSRRDPSPSPPPKVSPPYNPSLPIPPSPPPPGERASPVGAGPETGADPVGGSVVGGPGLRVVPGSGRDADRPAPKSDHAALVEHFVTRWAERYGGKKYPFQPIDGRKASELLARCAGDLAEARAVVDRYLAATDPFYAGHPLATLTSASQLPRFFVDPKQARPLRPTGTACVGRVRADN